ncbi:MAG: carboxypeptidase-like regulatory domain-containing protein, partial [Bryobacteraceae bacterium]
DSQGSQMASAFSRPNASPGFVHNSGVKTATKDGMDASRQPLRPGMGEIRVVLGADGASISGRVQDENEKPIGQAFVQLVIASLPGPPSQSEWQTAFTDDDGQFSFPSVPPGSYLVFAIADQEDAYSVSPQMLSRLRSKATPVKVSAKEVKQLVLQPLSVERTYP